MKLTVRNIGKISDASIDIRGIATIAGENNTGKSTIGKTLFALFAGFHHIDRQIEQDRVQSIEKVLRGYFYSILDFDTRLSAIDIAHKLAQQLTFSASNSNDIAVRISSTISNLVEKEGRTHDTSMDDDFEKIVIRVQDILSIRDEAAIRRILTRAFSAEFSGQVNNIYQDNLGYVNLTIKNRDSGITIRANQAVSFENAFDLDTQAIYIDDPFILDEERYRMRFGLHLDHRVALQHALFGPAGSINSIAEVVANDKLSSIYQALNQVCPGDTLIAPSRESSSLMRYDAGYRDPNSDRILDAKNLSTGLKTFAIIKTLLQNGTLSENGTIILDEPEIHLHPEWQLILAKIVVLLQKEYGMHILINTHSPYFLNALEVYAAKYSIADKCTYYLASSHGKTSHIEDVTGNTEAIYARLARPFQILENEAFS